MAATAARTSRNNTAAALSVPAVQPPALPLPRGIQKKTASNDHFSIDGTLVQSLAPLKSFLRKDEDKNEQPPPDANGWADFKSEKCSKVTQERKAVQIKTAARKRFSIIECIDCWRIETYG